MKWLFDSIIEKVKKWTGRAGGQDPVKAAQDKVQKHQQEATIAVEKSSTADDKETLEKLRDDVVGKDSAPRKKRPCGNQSLCNGLTSACRSDGSNPDEECCCGGLTMGFAGGYLTTGDLFVYKHGVRSSDTNTTSSWCAVCPLRRGGDGGPVCSRCISCGFLYRFNSCYCCVVRTGINAVWDG